MVPSGLITRQIGDKVYVLVGIKSEAEEKTYGPGVPHWLAFGGDAPIIEKVPDGHRISQGVNLPL